MALAKDEREMVKQGKGCLGKAKDDEPVFILRGQDVLAPDCVEKWATDAQLLGTVPWDKIREARDLAQAMREYPGRRNPT